MYCRRAALTTLAALVHALGFCLPPPTAALVASMRLMLLPRSPTGAPLPHKNTAVDAAATGWRTGADVPSKLAGGARDQCPGSCVR